MRGARPSTTVGLPDDIVSIVGERRPQPASDELHDAILRVGFNAQSPRGPNLKGVIVVRIVAPDRLRGCGQDANRGVRRERANRGRVQDPPDLASSAKLVEVCLKGFAGSRTSGRAGGERMFSRRR